MRAKIVFPDGSWFIGNRRWYFYNETKGTHHFIVESSGHDEFRRLIGRKIAVPINRAQYFVLGE